MSRILIGIWVIGLEHHSLVGPEEGLDEVFLSWGIVVLIVKPSVPSGRGLLRDQEPLVVVCILDPSTSVLI